MVLFGLPAAAVQHAACMMDAASADADELEYVALVDNSVVFSVETASTDLADETAAIVVLVVEKIFLELGADDNYTPDTAPAQIDYNASGFVVLLLVVVVAITFPLDEVAVQSIVAMTLY